jgi:hypothetical protein
MYYMTLRKIGYDMKLYSIYIILYDIIYYNMIWYYVWYDMIYNMIWYDMTCDTIRYNTILHDTIKMIRYDTIYMIWYVIYFGLHGLVPWSVPIEKECWNIRSKSSETSHSQNVCRDMRRIKFTPSVIPAPCRCATWNSVSSRYLASLIMTGAQNVP